MRKLATYQGIIENGRVRLPSDAGIPETTLAPVLVADAGRDSVRYIASPHLADPQQARDFELQVIDDATKARV